MSAPRNIIAASIRMHYARLDAIAKHEALQVELARLKREAMHLALVRGLDALVRGLDAPYTLEQ